MIIKEIINCDIFNNRCGIYRSSFMCLASHLVEKNARYTTSSSKPTKIYCDNISTIKLAKNSVLHGRSKHIDVGYHYLRDLV